ncbi:response regulator receiver modulated diguanylate cyclase [Rippkaea orientalis PCC 8801]|uniref:Response regulator receiver modulated diguanylate cyclase n=1 Tax=Rippkaea orientalis (strain PCC 8801 / RF-1) TaxID=41431 RepID=B7K273_RIPO1|nr:PleD family two-component system response regulator [Rippkaea orientalis]ACK65209.1 response regulator receiver modulated diguanylate cyclase [Rippkaea orientalis PCC 8801]
MKPFKPEEFLILVVDDISKNVQLLIEILDTVGYATTFAIGGKQALERVKSVKPDLILLDLMMPEINGLEVCKILKSDEATANIPILFLTASNDKEHLIKAFEQGAVDYVTKPFKVPELLARVKTHVELKQVQKQLQEACQTMKKLADTDELTGIANRRCLLEFAQREFQRSLRYGTPFCLLMIDVDHFKNINDKYGHPNGDKAIQWVVEIIKLGLREVDFFGRFGGEEFIVVLPQTALGGALEVAERIREAIASQPLTLEQDTVTLTASIGVATYTGEDKTVVGMIQRADKSLYQAKAKGRNQVIAIP